MIETLLQAFSYTFMWRALIVGIAIAISSSFVGSFLVLKKFSMIGHGLSHVAFGAVAIGLFTNQAPLLVAVPIVVVMSIFILKINDKVNIPGDAAIGLLAAFSMALGTTLASVGGGFNVDLNTYLFGSILTIRQTDVYLAVLFSVVIIGVVFLYYHDLFSMTYDDQFAKVTGIKTSNLNTLLAILTGITIVIGIRVIGTILISALIIFPTVIAMQFGQGFKRTILIGVTTQVIIVVSGLMLSYLYDLPSGSAIVLLNGFVFLAISLYNGFRRLKTA